MKVGIAIMCKDEGRVIERCLASLVTLAPDIVIITDTGSTDDTIIKAGLFLQAHNLKFKIYNETWKDFGQNRTLLLERARNETDIDYFLMVDADDCLSYSDDFDSITFKTSLRHDVYNVRHTVGPVSYQLPKLTTNHRAFTYVGSTHEYVDVGNAEQGVTDSLWITQYNDSMRRITNRKTLEDIELLRRDLKEHPEAGARALFYLGISYTNNGQLKEAKDAFLQRIALGGWAEEVFYSHYQLAKLYQTDKDGFDDVIAHCIKGHQAFPTRIECLFELKVYLERQGHPKLAELLVSTLRTIRHPGKGLFLEDNKYYVFT